MRLATLLAAAAPNPGPHHPPALYDPGIIATMPQVLGTAIACLGFFLAWVSIMAAVQSGGWWPYIAAAVVGIGMLIGGWVWCSTSYDDAKAAAGRKVAASEHKLNDYEIRYNESVKRWLAEDYGITATDGSIHTLIAGGHLVASTRVGQKSIELAPTTQNTLAVRTVGGDVLQPSDVNR